MSWFRRVSLGFLLLLHLTAAATEQVFLDDTAANQVLRRQRRANSIFEEMKQGNMERECVEERCDFEEAREIFEDLDKTQEFWNKYVDGDACESLPCAHNGLCKDGIGSYSCYCLSGYKGYNCEIVIPELCENENGGCEHFCNVRAGNVRCSCADGYFLGSDDKSCDSNEVFKCGALVNDKTRSTFRYERQNTTTTATATNDTASDHAPRQNQNQTDHGGNATATDQSSPPDESSPTDESPSLDESSSPGNASHRRFLLEQIEAQYGGSSMTRIVNGEACPPGECPWQALLLNEDQRGFCGGTILNEYVILTAAHCMNETRYIYVKLGEFDVLVDHGNEATYQVETIITHNKYVAHTYHNDIALIKLTTPIKFSKYILPACIPEQEFAEKVLMRQAMGTVSGFGRLGEGRQPSTIMQRLSVPYVDRRICMESTQLTITTRMFCAGYDTIAKDACQGDSGGPHVTLYKNTYFVTGIVSWGEGCARKGKYGVYTQVSKYVRWINSGIAQLMPKEKSGGGGGRAKRNGETRSITRLVL